MWNNVKEGSIKLRHAVTLFYFKVFQTINNIQVYQLKVFHFPSFTFLSQILYSFYKTTEDIWILKISFEGKLINTLIDIRRACYFHDNTELSFVWIEYSYNIRYNVAKDMIVVNDNSWAEFRIEFAYIKTKNISSCYGFLVGNRCEYIHLHV